MSLTGALVPIVLIPRFTSYIGPNAGLSSLPVDVSAYASGTIVAWRGPFVGTSPFFSIVIAESEDRVIWTNLATINLTSLTTDQATVTLTRKWLRVTAILTGTSIAVSSWCTGYLERRVS